MAYTWLTISSKTGVVLEELRDLNVTSIKKQMMAYTSTTATLPLTTAPEGWEAATSEYAACPVLLDGETPVWEGIVTKQTPDHTDTVKMSISTIEAYFDRRYVGDRIYAGVPQNLIMKDLIERFIATGTNGGIPIRVQIVGGSGQARDRTYKDQDDKTIYSVLRELSGVLGGPEWTVTTEKVAPTADGRQRYGFVFIVGDRIGTAAPADRAPAATFELPGSITEFQSPRDYGAGKGANDVMAVSTAVGDVRPQSPHIVRTDPVRPTVEHRFTPSTSITDVGTLTEHARGVAAAVANGTRSLVLKARADADPRLGIDWVIGDDIRYLVQAPAYPNGVLDGVSRAVGWTLALGANQEVTPVLLSDGIEED